MNLAFLSLASRSVIVWLLIGFLSNPVGFVTESLSFFITFNTFVELFLYALWHKRRKYKDIEVIPKVKLNSIESIILKSIQESSVNEKIYMY